MKKAQKKTEINFWKEYKMKYKELFMNKKQIIKKNYEYFKEIMTNFYNIDLDSDNEYKMKYYLYQKIFLAIMSYKKLLKQNPRKTSK